MNEGDFVNHMYVLKDDGEVEQVYAPYNHTMVVICGSPEEAKRIFNDLKKAFGNDGIIEKLMEIPFED